MTVLQKLLPQSGDIVFGRYELRDELGRGGFGVVYRATQRGLDEDVAMKILLPHVLENEDIYTRFEREIMVAKGLRHPNSIRILDVGRTDKGLPFYVMEYVKGRSLDAVLRAEGCMSPQRTRKILVKVLGSLAEAHSQGVVHRDLKPANLMLTEVFGEKDIVKVLDFGIAKALGQDGSVQQTSTGMVLGTPAYMSPEQALGRKDLNGQSDLYSIGLILAECLSGKPVVSGETPYLVVAAHASRSPLPFDARLAQSPLWPILQRATSKDREYRFQTAGEMRDAFTALGPLPDQADPSFLDPAYPEQPPPSFPDFTPHSMQHSGMVVGGYNTNAQTMAAPSGQFFQEAPTGGSAKKGMLILFAVLLLVGGGVFAAIQMGGKSNTIEAQPVEDDSGTSGEERTEQESSEVASNDDPTSPTNSNSGGDNNTAPPTTPNTVTPPTTTPPANNGGQVAVVTSPPVTGPSLEAVSAAVDEGQERVAESAPETHTVRIRGNRPFRVVLAGETLGELPLDLNVPRVDYELSLEFSRAGYESESIPISFLAEGDVDVSLSRRRGSDSHASNSSSSDDDDDGSSSDNDSSADDNSPWGSATIRE